MCCLLTWNEWDDQGPGRHFVEELEDVSHGKGKQQRRKSRFDFSDRDEIHRAGPIKRTSYNTNYNSVGALAEVEYLPCSRKVNWLNCQQMAKQNEVRASEKVYPQWCCVVRLKYFVKIQICNAQNGKAKLNNN